MSQYPNNQNIPAYQPQPKKGKSTGLIVGLIVGGVVILSIFVVGCFATFLFPALSKARQAAQQIKVSSQVMSIAQAINFYSADYKDMYPPLNGWDQALITRGFVPTDMFDSVRIEGSGNEMIYTPPPGRNGAPVGKVTDISLPGQWVLVREDETKLPTNTPLVNVGFADGSVQAISREQLAAKLVAQKVAADAIKAMK